MASRKIKRRPAGLAALIAALLAAGVAYGAPKAAPAYRAPRTAAGQPDLQGIWSNMSATMLQRAPNAKTLAMTEAEAAGAEKMISTGIQAVLGGAGPVDVSKPPPVLKQAPEVEWGLPPILVARVNGQPRSSQIVEPANGQLPLTDAARRGAKPYPPQVVTTEGPEVRPLEERCLTNEFRQEGPPMVGVLIGAPFQVLQTPDHVVILTETTHNARVIRLRDTARPHASVRPWTGDSVGRWEGETLVIETTNLSPTQGLMAMPLMVAYSARTKVTERITRKAKDEILYEFTVEDPSLFTSAWRAESPWRAAKGPIYESACHEGNRSLALILSGARHEELAAAAAAAANAH